jgi:hypothetical protein
MTKLPDHEELLPQAPSSKHNLLVEWWWRELVFRCRLVWVFPEHRTTQAAIRFPPNINVQKVKAAVYFSATSNWMYSIQLITDIFQLIW